jgi:hypothetical protein
VRTSAAVAAFGRAWAACSSPSCHAWCCRYAALLSPSVTTVRASPDRRHAEAGVRPRRSGQARTDQLSAEFPSPLAATRPVPQTGYAASPHGRSHRADRNGPFGSTRRDLRTYEPALGRALNSPVERCSSGGEQPQTERSRNPFSLPSAKFLERPELDGRGSSFAQAFRLARLARMASRCRDGDTPAAVELGTHRSPGDASFAARSRPPPPFG